MRWVTAVQVKKRQEAPTLKRPEKNVLNASVSEEFALQRWVFLNIISCSLHKNYAASLAVRPGDLS
jgi:hypothetical protein